MTSQSHTDAIGTRRRPAPPRPGAASRRASVAPISYVPDAFDPTHLPAAAASLPGQFGLVYPAHRTGRGVWFSLLVIVASVIGFIGWRAQHSGASDSSSGVTYTSTAGHFAAHFPSQPTETARVERHGAWALTLHIAGVTGQAVVVAGDVSGPMRVAARHQMFGALDRVTSMDGIDLTSVKNVHFHGAPARQGNYVTPSGDVFSVLIAMPSARHYFFIGAPLGPQFDAFKASFRILS
jgi:hypothetical protein